jgi:hypothetical protein
MFRWVGAACLAVAAAASGVTDPSGEGPGFTASETQWAALGKDCPSDAPARPLSVVARDSVAPSVFGADMNSQWAGIARRVPGGWGGYFLENGTPTLYLVDPAQKGNALAALRTEGIHLPSYTIVKPGRWDFAQLYDWYEYIRWHTISGSVTGMSMSDIQEATNRLEYGVIDEAARKRLELPSVASCRFLPRV